MSVARRFEFVIGSFLIIDLAKISAFPISYLVLLLAPTNPHTRFVTGGSVFRAKLPAITGGPDFGRGLFFVVLAPFHPIGRF